jgi:hypothetical protein
VQVILENTSTKKLYTYSVNPGSLLGVTIPSGTYSIEVNTGTTTLAATTFDLYSQAATMVFAVGQASNGTVNLETKNVRNLI